MYLKEADGFAAPITIIADSRVVDLDIAEVLDRGRLSIVTTDENGSIKSYDLTDGRLRASLLLQTTDQLRGVSFDKRPLGQCFESYMSVVNVKSQTIDIYAYATDFSANGGYKLLASKSLATPLDIASVPLDNLALFPLLVTSSLFAESLTDQFRYAGSVQLTGITGSYLLNAEDRLDIINNEFFSLPLRDSVDTSTITGIKWLDLDGDGTRDANEPGIPGVSIYLDLNGDNLLGGNEPRTLTDVNGNYALSLPGPGAYTVREVIGPEYVQTFPASGEHVVAFSGSQLRQSYDFGNSSSLDFGDAPDSYRTTSAGGGPSHRILTGLSIGRSPDRELNGVPSIGADGDDVRGQVSDSGTVVNDEDGVRQLTEIVPGANATFEVTMTNTTGSTAYLQAWFDFNRNGSFDDAGEQVIINSTPAGAMSFNIAIPETVTRGSLFTRFRYSLTAGLDVGGPADSGEVEDYLFTVINGAVGEGELRHNAVNPADVNGDGFVTAIDALLVINELSRAQRPREGEPAFSTTQRFTDVSGDGRVTPLDALQVINTISRRTRQAAAESEASVLEAPKTTSNRQLESTPYLRGQILKKSSRTSSPNPQIRSVELDEDERTENAVFDLLARDISKVWR